MKIDRIHVYDQHSFHNPRNCEAAESFYRTLAEFTYSFIGKPCFNVQEQTYFRCQFKNEIMRTNCAVVNCKNYCGITNSNNNNYNNAVNVMQYYYERTASVVYV